MKYDFTSILDRRGKDAVAIDAVGAPGSPYPAPREGFDVIPMWVADMNFPVVPTVQQAMIERVEHPAFGYFDPPAEYYESIIRWQESRNGVTGRKSEHIGYENGVLGGVSAAVQAFTSPGDKILIHSPTYVGFTHTMDDTGRVIVHSELKRDEQGIWRMDYEDMEFDDDFDGIWVNEALIHVPEDELPGILEKLTEALCQNGILFLSFQEGDFEGQRSGRYFCEYTREELERILTETGRLEILKLWTTEDEDREAGDKLLNVLAKKIS